MHSGWGVQLAVKFWSSAELVEMCMPEQYILYNGNGRNQKCCLRLVILEVRYPPTDRKVRETVHAIKMGTGLDEHIIHRKGTVSTCRIFSVQWNLISSTTIGIDNYLTALVDSYLSEERSGMMPMTDPRSVLLPCPSPLVLKP